MAGVLAGQPFASRLIGDPSLSSRPMKRIVDPLRLMGAKIEGQGEKQTAPLEIQGGAADRHRVHAARRQRAVEVVPAARRAFRQRHHQRDRKNALARPHRAPAGPFPRAARHRPQPREGKTIRVRGGTRLHGRDFNVPGDFSSAAFWIAAAAAMPGADLTVTNLGLNGTRTGLLSVLLRMGAHIHESISDSSCEPFGTVRVYGRKLRGTKISGAEIANVIDELPIIAVIGAIAEGDTEIRDARELRVKETDRIAAMAANLRAFGVKVTEHDDGMTVHGGGGENSPARKSAASATTASPWPAPSSASSPRAKPPSPTPPASPPPTRLSRKTSTRSPPSTKAASARGSPAGNSQSSVILSLSKEWTVIS